MNSYQSEQAYTELGRIVLVNKMCQGEFPFNPNPGILYVKPYFSVSAMTWLVYDFCKRVLTETWTGFSDEGIVVMFDKEVRVVVLNQTLYTILCSVYQVEHIWVCSDFRKILDCAY